MPLDPHAVGNTTDPAEVRWTSKDSLLYALSIGAGTEELAFTTENTTGTPQQAFPTQAVMLGLLAAESPMPAIGEYDPAMLVHGRQAITFHRPLPPQGTATFRRRVVALHDKGDAAVAVLETTSTIDDGPLFTSQTSLFIRGAGGWGGDRGPRRASIVPPERAADHHVTYQTSPDQALIYRLNGDRNPLHSDPAFATRAGFDRPILHGLCTFGFTGRALLHTLCAGDPARFAHIEARFAAPVRPGETLDVSIWTTRPGEAVFRTAVADRVVIDQGLLRYRV